MNLDNPDRDMVIFGLQPVFLVIVFVIYFLFLKTKNKHKVTKLIINIIFVSLVLFLSLGIHGHFFHRFDLQVESHTIKSGYKAKFAVITDTHLGPFKDQVFMQTVVDRINTIPDLDAVLIPGDFTYIPDISKLPQLFAPLKQLKVPTYAVLGNHDVQKPGPKLDQELIEALTLNNVILIDNKIESIQLKSGDPLSIIGLRDLWLENYNTDPIEYIQTQTQVKNYLILAHQPDVVRGYNRLNSTPLLTVTGHTHCGQVRIPGLYNSHLPVVDKYFDKGFYKAVGSYAQLSNPQESNDPKLFISCGVGDVGLPIRINNPRVIDVLNII